MTCVVISCEHASAALPKGCAQWFAGAKADLHSHLGFDPGARAVARRLAAALQAPLIAGRYSRLLIDLNRSPHNPRRFSRYTRPLPAAVRVAIEQDYYWPYRQAVEQAVAAGLKQGGPVLHLAVHSFTPVLDGRVRRVDLGLLYDPRRALEKIACRRLKQDLEAAMPGLRVRCNQPYRGTADGLTRGLRQLYPQTGYLGIELEFNQTLLVAGGTARLSRLLKNSLLIRATDGPAESGAP